MSYSLGYGLRHPGLEAQVIHIQSVVCNKTKLITVMLKQQPHVSLLVVWANRERRRPLVIQ